MEIKKLKFVFAFMGIFSTNFLFSQQTEKQDNIETLQLGIDILKRYFYDDNEWYIAKPSVARDVKGLINFIENDPIDTTINNLHKSFNRGETYVFRLPENVSDSMMVPGFYPNSELSKRIESETSKTRAGRAGESIVCKEGFVFMLILPAIFLFPHSCGLIHFFCSLILQDNF